MTTWPADAYVEWLARLIEHVGHAVDVVETEDFYRSVCARYGVPPREIVIRPEEDAALPPLPAPPPSAEERKFTVVQTERGLWYVNELIALEGGGTLHDPRGFATLHPLTIKRQQGKGQPCFFCQGRFILHSGETSHWKINCDALSAGDWRALASMAAPLLGSTFSVIEAVPGTNAERFAMALRAFLQPKDKAGEKPLLIVDDVLTTGASMETHRADRRAVGIVAFARTTPAKWITPLFTAAQTTPTQKG